MASFDTVNYSLRPSKSAQRGLIFEGLKALSVSMDLTNAAYIGFGSIWFTDFIMAHKMLDIEEMISIEADDIGYRRAAFNKVYRTISLRHGRSHDILPQILEENGFRTRPWIIWLDYDSALQEEIVEEVQWLIVNAPPNSIVLLTFSATLNAYGKPVNRPARIKALLGDVVPDDLAKELCDKDNLPLTLSKYMLDFLSSEVADTARPGGFVEAFNVPYSDTVSMVTVGGVLPAPGAVPAARAVVADAKWKCRLEEVIQAPQMTLKEVATLQAEMPAVDQLTRERIQEIGFDLQDEQIRSFQRYYKYLPSFAEIVG